MRSNKAVAQYELEKACYILDKTRIIGYNTYSSKGYNEDIVRVGTL